MYFLGNSQVKAILIYLKSDVDQSGGHEGRNISPSSSFPTYLAATVSRGICT
jgi:hypothetical protein